MVFMWIAGVNSLECYVCNSAKDKHCDDINLQPAVSVKGFLQNCTLPPGAYPDDEPLCRRLEFTSNKTHLCDPCDWDIKEWFISHLQRIWRSIGLWGAVAGSSQSHRNRVPVMTLLIWPRHRVSASLTDAMDHPSLEAVWPSSPSSQLPFFCGISSSANYIVCGWWVKKNRKEELHEWFNDSIFIHN